MKLPVEMHDVALDANGNIVVSCAHSAEDALTVMRALNAMPAMDRLLEAAINGIDYMPSGRPQMELREAIADAIEASCAPRIVLPN
jgi:hypothetical protein